MSLSFTSNSILTTVQDLGRIGTRDLGINPSGAMDTHAVRLINTLLGNDENEAVLEMHFPAADIKFNENAVIALGGADFGATIDDNLIENWRAIYVNKGSILKFTEKLFGARQYLSVKSGFETEKWLGSASVNLVAGIGKSLKKDDELNFKSKTQVSNPQAKIANSLLPLYSKFPTVRVIAGSNFEKLNALSEQTFLKKTFTISTESNRMGFRLTGEPLYLSDNTELISTAVNFGTIQLLPNGQMIILMADHQTTGGYPQIANVISSDLPLLAQLNANDKVAFHQVSINEAERLTLQFERDLNFLKLGIQFNQTL
jgi:antagonist of KipI